MTDLPTVAFDGHIRIEPEPRPVRVRAGDKTIAWSDRALRLQEGDRAAVHYLPVASLAALDWTSSDTVTHCPWKGDARYCSLEGMDDLVWQYADAKPDVALLADYVAFDGQRTEIELQDATAVSPAGVLQSVDAHWSPRIVADFNGNDVMAVKVLGEFNWHSHPETDDLFFVLSGRLRIELPDDRSVTLGPGELYVVPRGVQHRPVAEIESEIVVMEPAGTPNTGDPTTAVHKPRV